MPRVIPRRRRPVGGSLQRVQKGWRGLALAAVICGGCSLLDPLNGLSDHYGQVGDGGGERDGSAGPDAAGGPDAADTDAGDAASDADAAAPPCDLTQPFAAPVPVTSLNTAEDEGSARLSPDEKTIYFDAARAAVDPSGHYHLYTATRSSLAADFGTPVEIAPTTVNDAGVDTYSPVTTDDGLTLFFERVDNGTSHLYLTKRPAGGSAASFAAPTELVGVNGGSYNANPFVRGTGAELWLAQATGTGSVAVFVASGTPPTFTPTAVPEVDAPPGTDTEYPVITSDRKTLFTARGTAKLDIYVAVRADPLLAFGTPTLLPNVNVASFSQHPTWVSADGCRLYLASDRPGMGGQDIYVASRPK